MFKVMVVDDIEVIRKQIKRLPLWNENEEFTIVDEAEDGQDALAKLKKQPVDLLITDIRMPRINGIELLREVYENQLATCTVFLSEHSEFSFAKEAIQYDIFDYLVKPVKSEELVALLKKVKDYIKEKEETRMQLKRLEDKLIDQVDIYYPHSCVSSIVYYISNGNRNDVIQAIEKMVEDTAKVLGYDMLKTAIVMQKACNEIRINVNENHQWIEMFIDTSYLADINLKKYSSINCMKKRIIETLEPCILIINRFIINNIKNPLIREICVYTITNVENNINITTISEALFLTKNYIGDIFKQETGMTVGEYITMVKIERAKQLIIEGSFKNYEIASKLGYKDVEYFGRLFKKNTNLSPTEFKNALKKKYSFEVLI